MEFIVWEEYSAPPLRHPQRGGGGGEQHKRRRRKHLEAQTYPGAGPTTTTTTVFSAAASVWLRWSKLKVIPLLFSSSRPPLRHRLHTWIPRKKSGSIDNHLFSLLSLLDLRNFGQRGRERERAKDTLRFIFLSNISVNSNSSNAKAKYSFADETYSPLYKSQ